MDLFTLRTYFLDVRHPFVQVVSVEGSEASDIGIAAIVRLVLQPSYRWSRVVRKARIVRWQRTLVRSVVGGKY